VPNQLIVRFLDFNLNPCLNQGIGHSAAGFERNISLVRNASGKNQYSHP
jgi:hypothetical protein